MRANRVSMALLVLSLVVGLVAPRSALAHSQVLTAPKGFGPRPPGAESIDTSTAKGKWKFTVEHLEGKAAQVVLVLRTLGEEHVMSLGGPPRLGKTYTTPRAVDAGTYEMRLFLHGGPPGPGRVVVVVQHP